MEPKKDKEYRAYQIHIKKGNRLYPYFNDLCSNGNNLYNTTNFYIRQAYTALKQEKRLESLQREVMETIYLNLEKMNENQTISHFKKLRKELEKPSHEQKEIKLNLFELPHRKKAFLGYNFLDCLFKTIKQTDYYSLPGQVNQQVIKNVVQNWKSFFESLKEYKKNPEKYNSRPNIPSYLPKGGKKEIVLSNQICKIVDMKFLSFPKTTGKLNIGKLFQVEGKYQQTRIVPKQDSFVVEVIYLIGEKKEITAKKECCMGIDLGLDNIATLVTNTGMAPVLYKGGKIKSLNRWYNKLRAHYFAALRNGKKSKEGSFYSKSLNKLDIKRNNQIKDLFHKISCDVVKTAKGQQIDTIVIGKNDGWKQEIELGKRNNQNFVQIPHSILINQITYKAHAEDIAVIVNEESYTSQASFLDEDDIPTYKSGNETNYVFSGKRISRGIYRSKNKFFINADVNGAANILRKVVPLAFANGIAAVCAKPLVVNVR